MRVAPPEDSDIARINLKESLQFLAGAAMAGEVWPASGVVYNFYQQQPQHHELVPISA
jgi:hypothetical protein